MPPVVRWIVTTAGATRAAAVITALDSSIGISLTVLASVPSPVTKPGGPSSRRVATPNAESAPETRPATTAIAMIGAVPGPRRTWTGGGCCGGRVDQAGAACQAVCAGSRWTSGP